MATSASLRTSSTYVTWALTFEADINKRIAYASASFGALRPGILAKKGAAGGYTCNKMKAHGVYSAHFISIVLSGSELDCWSVMEELSSRLRRAFHNKCVRIMCQITMHLPNHPQTLQSTWHSIWSIELEDLTYYHTIVSCAWPCMWLAWTSRAYRASFSPAPWSTADHWQPAQDFWVNTYNY
jgi:hypothetical protein